jgi:hypothetical protein
VVNTLASTVGINGRLTYSVWGVICLLFLLFTIA